jgi:uncharacterized coiled-coil DUF342 family protein
LAPKEKPDTLEAVSDADEIKKKLAELKARIGETQKSIRQVRATINPPAKKTSQVRVRKPKN